MTCLHLVTIVSVRPDSWKYFCSAFKSYHRKPIYRDFFTPSHNEKNGHFCPTKFNSYFFPRNKPCLLLLTSNSQYQKNIPARFHKYPFFPQTYHPISANMQSPLSLSYTLPLHLGSCMILLDCFHRYPNHHSAIRKILLLQQAFVLFYFF